MKKSIFYIGMNKSRNTAKIIWKKVISVSKQDNLC